MVNDFILDTVFEYLLRNGPYIFESLISIIHAMNKWLIFIDTFGIDQSIFIEHQVSINTEIIFTGLTHDGIHFFSPNTFAIINSSCPHIFLHSTNELRPLHFPSFIPDPCYSIFSYLIQSINISILVITIIQ